MFAIRHRHWIPFGFAGAAFVGFVVLAAMQDTLLGSTKVIASGTPASFEPVRLEEGERYDLIVETPNPTSGFVGVLEASLEDAEEDSVLFELEDAYWAESGTWQEDGESGTWYEANAKTEFYFTAPASGRYQLSLSQKNNQGSALTLEVRLRRRPFSGMPLFFAILLFGVAGLIVRVRRRSLVLEHLAGLAPGSLLSIQGTVYTLEETLGWEEAGALLPVANEHHAFSATLKLRGPKGHPRALYIETFWWSWASGDEDYEGAHDALLLSLEIAPREGEALSAAGEGVEWRGDTYWLSEDNSGRGREQPGEDRYYESQAHLPTRTGGRLAKTSSREVAGIPATPGDLVLWRALHEGHPDEWSAGQAIDWKLIDILEEAKHGAG